MFLFYIFLLDLHSKYNGYFPLSAYTHDYWKLILLLSLCNIDVAHLLSRILLLLCSIYMDQLQSTRSHANSWMFLAYFNPHTYFYFFQEKNGGF
jgi:hypothetical protein